MIESYRSPLGEDIFKGNWGAVAGGDSLRPIEECFIDLRILDAVVSVGDILRAFGNRLESPPNGTANGRYLLKAPDGAVMGFVIFFQFSNGDVSDVDVKFDFVRHDGGGDA